MAQTLRGVEQALFYLKAANETGSVHLARKPFDFEKDVPPEHLMQYSETAERHLDTGRKDAALLLKTLADAGYKFEPGHRFLDFGCANARVMRHMRDWAEQGEGWGVDVNANVIIWCLEHMSPPFHFAVSTLHTHLPFESGYFNLIFCNSVFTHIDDMFFSWLLELRRVTAIGGYLYITILDHGSTEAMRDKPKAFLSTHVSGNPDFQEFVDQKEDFVAVRRGKGCVTFIDSSFFEALAKPWFDVMGTVDIALGQFQKAYVLKRVR